MEPVTLAYYAAVCAVLGVLAPWMGNLMVRFLIGAVVGVVAAALMPQVQAAMAH